MGRTHAASGGLAFAAGAPLLPALGVHLSPVGLAVGVVAAAGAALLPDLDHPSSTVARALGPLSGALVRLPGRRRVVHGARRAGGPGRHPGADRRRGARFRLATLTTGGLAERLLIGPAMLVAAGIVTWHLTGGAAATDLYGVVVHTMRGAR